MRSGKLKFAQYAGLLRLWYIIVTSEKGRDFRFQQVAGNHNPIYESYYLLVDPSNHGSVGALDAAKFLKKSGLPDAILSKIWDLSDPNGKGYLNKPGFFVALKLVSLAQNAREVNIANILSDVPPPKMADVPAVLQNNVINSVQATLSDWAIKPHEREKYDQLFESLQPLNGVIPGNKVKGLLMDSKLPLDTLGRIWDLADMDKDGSLDRHEFVVAMHLVYKALEKYAIPNSVPPELLPPGKRKDPLPPIIPIAPITKPVEPVKPAVPPVPQAPWVVTAEERQRYDVMFHHADVDKDGFVSGHEIKNVFLQSGVAQQVLAHIWGLCDMKQTGKLNGEQFALAMWLISQKLQGKDPPAALTPEMIPPSARGKSAEHVNLPIYNVLGAQSRENGVPFSNPFIQGNRARITPKLRRDSLRVCLLKNILHKKCLKMNKLPENLDLVLRGRHPVQMCKEANFVMTPKEGPDQLCESKRVVVKGEESLNVDCYSEEEIDSPTPRELCSEMRDENKNNNFHVNLNVKQNNNNSGNSNINQKCNGKDELDTNNITLMEVECDDAIKYYHKEKNINASDKRVDINNFQSDSPNFTLAENVELETNCVIKTFNQLRITQDREE